MANGVDAGPATAAAVHVCHTAPSPMTLPGLPHAAAPPPDEKLWTLRHGRHTAVCWQRLHPLGLELRLDVNRDTMRTAVVKTVEEARAASAQMRDAMQAKGWVE